MKVLFKVKTEWLEVELSQWEELGIKEVGIKGMIWKLKRKCQKGLFLRGDEVKISDIKFQRLEK